METTPNNITKKFDAAKVCDMLIANIDKRNTMTSKWRGVDVAFRKLLTFTEYVDLVRNVIEMCTDTNGVDIHTEMVEFAFRLNVLAFFTDIALPDNIEDQFRYVFWTDIYKFVTEHVDSGQLETLRQTIDWIIR